MTGRSWFLVPMASLLLLGVACPTGSGDDDDDSGPAEVGPPSLEATIDPDPPIVGRNAMVIDVLDGQGAGIDGAALTVVPWMDVHGHGSTEEPLIEALGGGSYQASPITFTMQGPWEVNVDAELPDGETVSHEFTYEAVWE